MEREGGEGETCVHCKRFTKVNRVLRDRVRKFSNFVIFFEILEYNFEYKYSCLTFFLFLPMILGLYIYSAINL